jgi:multidrug efflux system outer membrane protein
MNWVAGQAIAALAPAALLAGCMTSPDYKRPDPAPPAEFRFQPGPPATPQSIADLPWWGVFNDKALQGLMGEGLANNTDLRVAVSRIEQARALVDVAHSQMSPQLGYQVGGGGERAFVPTESSVGAVTVGSIGAALNAAWEFDVWGRIRKSTQAAQANLLAQEEVRRGVMLTLVTDIATGYFRLLELDRELAIAQESSDTFRQSVDLFTKRFEAGRDNRLPMDRSQANYEAAGARTAEIKRLIAQQENALSILVGGYPRAIERGRPLVEQTLPDTPLSDTTALLQRRPDILAAEQTMKRANAEIGVAVANFYPRIGLSALLGGIGADVRDTWNSFGVWSLGLSAAGPLFTGGRLEAEYKNRQAFWDETVAGYKKTVLVAFQETSDALAAQQTLVQRRTSLENQVAALQRSSQFARARYDEGRAGYFEVLEAQQQLFPAEDALAQTRRDQLLAVVNLYKALGGGWNLTPEQWNQARADAAAPAASSGARHGQGDQAR